MSETMGPIAYGDNEQNVFLGREMAQRREDYSEDTARKIDQEVYRIVTEQHVLARSIVRENREKLDRLAVALLERETLDSEEIRACMEGRELPKRTRVVIPSYSERKKKEKKERSPIFSSPGKPATGEA